MTSDNFLENLWLWKCELPEKDYSINKDFELDKLRKSEWSPEFIQLMNNRMTQSAFRYGLIHKGKGDIRRIKSAIKRLNKYLESGNTEFLIDASNLCMCEFIKPGLPDTYFHSIDDGEHFK